MEKTEMKGGIAKFQSESKNMYNNPKVLNEIIQNMSEKIDELQAKAEAYDRLMSGGKFTMKEMANIKKRPVTIDKDGTINAHGAEPHLARGGFAGYSDCWANDADDYEEIPENFVEIPDGFDWATSLTLPDGWEVK